MADEDIILLAITDKENGVDISEKYPIIQEKYSKVFEMINSGDIFKNPNYRQDIEFMLEQKKIYRKNKFQADKAIGMRFAPMLGDKFNQLSAQDLKKAEKKAAAKAASNSRA